MEVSLQAFNPQPVRIDIIKKGRLKEILSLRHLNLKDEIWINTEAFPTNEKQDNGMAVLAERLTTGTDKEAVFTMIYKLLIDSKYKTYKKFYKKFVNASNVIPSFYQALELVFTQSQPNIVLPSDSNEKKSL